MTEYRYLHYDVFTDTRFEGNPLAVLPDARGLSDAQMQTIAAEMAFSETTFVLPAEGDGTDVRMRIFTPAQELPMAGHPTIGTTFALVREGEIVPGTLRFTFGLNVGPTPVDLEWAGEALGFAWMTQRVPAFGETFEDAPTREAVAAAVGLEAADLAPDVPLQVVSTGVAFLFVPLRSRAAVDRAAPNLEVMRRLAIERGLDHYYVFTTDPGEAGDPPATAYSRMFAPVLGIMEDPATGGACGPLGGYLVQHGLVPVADARGIVNLQGAAMGRPSWLHIQVEGAPGAVGHVRVGGSSVLVATGVLEV
ncbi:MAG: PhzF family phenazine biosynthesis protein [Dehalococcoidia bacterium]|nr:PhzF family phenazine biosynthesis protein [Dehalococcoidia bacterium]